MMQVIEVNTLIMQECNSNLFKNILVFFYHLVVFFIFTSIFSTNDIFSISFVENIDVKIKKTTIGFNLIHKLNLLLPRSFIIVFSDLIWTMERFFTEAVARRCSIKKVLLEISQNSQENTCARVSFSIEISKNTLSYRTPLVPVSVFTINRIGLT